MQQSLLSPAYLPEGKKHAAKHASQVPQKELEDCAERCGNLCI